MLGRTLNRVPMKVGPEAMQTFEAAVPLETHWRKATCAEVDCRHYLLGWQTLADETDTTQYGGADRARYIREQSGRRFREHRNEVGITVFVFEAGQRCFRAGQHRAPIEREPLYLVRGGDHRGDPLGLGVRAHTRAEFWTEELGENISRFIDAKQRG